MSKRYGRNQKRQAKERIESLEKRNKSLQERGYRNERIVRDTANVLGDYFVTLPVNRHEISDLRQLREGWRIASHNIVGIRVIGHFPLNNSVSEMLLDYPTLSTFLYCVLSGGE